MKGFGSKKAKRIRLGQTESSSRRHRLTLLASISLFSMILPILFSSTGLHNVFVIATSSMSPTLNPGDIVIAAPPQSSVQNGTIIIFKSPLGGFECHRIVGSQSLGADVGYLTKGDNNNSTDSFLVYSKSIVGTFLFSLQSIGFLFLIPREAALAVTMVLMISYLILEFRGGKKPFKAKKTETNKIPIKNLCSVGLIILFIVAADVTFPQSSVRLIYPNSTSSASVTTPKVVLQTGSAGTSTVFNAGVNANVTVQANVLQWYDNGWNYRKAITIDPTKVPNTDQSNFPVLVNLASDTNLQANARSDGYDILFTSADGATKIPYEREQYTSGTGALVAWVKVATLSHLSNTVIYMYYGNPGATDQQDRINVWDSNFKGVWHLNQAIGGSNGIKDSTSYNNHGTDYGALTLGATGKIGNAVNFDGIDDYVSIPNSVSLQLTTSLTIEGWIKLDSFGLGSDVDPILRKGEANPNDYQLGVHNQRHALMIEENDDQGVTGNTTLSSVTWYYVVGTWDGSNRVIYLNGNPDATNSYSGSIVPDTRTIYIGGRSGADLADGIMDEVRVSNVKRSADWIKTEYNNQNSPSTFYSLGAQETRVTFSYDYVLKAVNQVPQAWKANLVSYSSSNLARLSSATISFRDGTTSNQIIVNNGVVTQSTEPQYDLASLGTTYISVNNVLASASGTSYLYVYLRILVPSSSVYLYYTIKFIFT